MSITEDERTLLGHIRSAGRPVEATTFFADMNSESSGERATERQIQLFRVYVDLWQRGLIRAAVPANGIEAHKMVLTDAGEASLDASGSR